MSTGFDPNAPLYVAPDAAEETPNCPKGVYGNGIGSASANHIMVSLFNPTSFKRFKDLDAANEAGEELSQLQTWLNIVAAINHPELGVLFVGTSPMGDYNTLMSVSKKGSFAPAHIANLGIGELIALPYLACNEALTKYKDAPMIVEVESRSWFDKKEKKQRSGSEIKGVWWKS